MQTKVSSLLSPWDKRQACATMGCSLILPYADGHVLLAAFHSHPPRPLESHVGVGEAEHPSVSLWVQVARPQQQRILYPSGEAGSEEIKHKDDKPADHKRGRVPGLGCN